MKHRTLTGTRIKFYAKAHSYLVAFLLLVASLQNGMAQAGGTMHYFTWDTVATLSTPGNDHPGLAGAFSGYVNGRLIAAGGANFPGDPPWRGGVKRWHDAVYRLDEGGRLIRVAALPQPSAYGLSITVPQGLLCVGGTNESGNVRDIVLIHSGSDSSIACLRLRELPADMEVTGGALIGDKIYITGIQNGSNNFISISLSALITPGSNANWTELPPCPGPARRYFSYGAQQDGAGIRLFLFGGRSPSNIMINDNYAFDPVRQSWYPIAPLPVAPGQTLMGAPCAAYGASSIFIFGGDDGRLFEERIRLEKLIATTTDTTQRRAFSRELEQSFVNHPGFGRDILLYNTITNTITTVGRMPEYPPVTTNAFFSNDELILVSGEIRPGVRTPLVLRAKIDKPTGAFGLINYTLLIVYLLLLVVVGVYFSFRQKTTDDYFKGGGRVPWWAAGLSVFGTALSAITFMAIPAKTYATDWAYFLYNMSVLLITPLIVVLFIPFFRRLDVTTAYEYLERRFNVAVRLFGSLSFMVFQIGRIAIVLYLPAIALSLVTGIDIYFCIISMGLLSLVYTMIGGIEAVIWTDVIQVFVLMGGTLFALVLIFLDLEGSWPSVTALLDDEQKFNILDLSFSLEIPTFWVVLIGGFFANLITYSSDQTLVQRYLTTHDEKTAGMTAWTNAILVVPATLLFFGVGTALFLYYSQHPAEVDPFASDIDSIFPWYIVTKLPQGVSGLVIAGLFSAAMSSLSSSMNSAATAFTTDIYERFHWGNGANLLNVARYSTFVVGIAGTLFAIWMSNSGIISLWDHFTQILGLFTGGLGGLFLLGILSKRAHGKGALIGLFVSSIVQYYISQYTSLHVFMYATVGMVSCMAVGQIASLIIPDSRKDDTSSYTIYGTLFRDKKQR